MKHARKRWNNIKTPLIAALIAVLLGFCLAYEFDIKPARLQSQAQFEAANFINNINRIKDYVEELEEDDQPVAEETRKLDEIEGHLSIFDTYYGDRQFEKALNEIDKGDKLGRKYFEDLWTRYPQPSEGVTGL